MFEYHIPFHIQGEIMKRLPVKSVIQFRSVSKAWKSLIDSSEFIAAHSLRRHTQQQHLLVSFGHPEVKDYVLFCRSYIDDDTFPQHRSIPTLPLYVTELGIPTVAGSSQGLVCLHGFDHDYKTEMTVLWNPLIRKSIAIALPSISDVWFGVCPVTNDPKMVSIPQSVRDCPETSHEDEVMVYTLSSGKWRSLSNNLFAKRIRESLCSSAATDRFIYWGIESETNTLMSFDLTCESFEVIDLPDSLAHRGPWVVNISDLRESLALLQYDENNGIRFCTVWMMEHGAQRSFTKLFTITTTYPIAGFSKSGVPIMEVNDDDDHHYVDAELVVYEPNSEHNNVLEMCPSFDTFTVNSYMETLLLLGRSDCISY